MSREAPSTTRFEPAAVPADWAARVLDGALDAVIVMDAAGRVVRLNAAAERLFGDRLDDAEGPPATPAGSSTAASRSARRTATGPSCRSSSR